MDRRSAQRQAVAPVYERNIEDIWKYRQDELKAAASLPHVIKYNDVPWKQGGNAYRKGFVGNLPSQRLKRVPLYTMALVEQILAPGGKSGKHRHFHEAVFYIIEGEGHEIHDDVQYTWEAGDVMCVPTYCVHQHFNASKDRPARLFYSVPLIFQFGGIYFVEQMEMHSDYRTSKSSDLVYGSKGELIGYRDAEGKEIRFSDVTLSPHSAAEATRKLPAIKKPKNTYENYVRELAETSHWRQSIPHVMKAKSLPWENTPMGRQKYFLSPYKPSPLRMYDAFVQEIPAGGRSGKHRHISEEVHKILSGKGYDIHDGVKWEWEAEDIVVVPINTVHQHFNADPQRPATFVSFQSRLYYYVGHGGFEHLEDAPDYKG